MAGTNPWQVRSWNDLLDLHLCFVRPASRALYQRLETAVLATRWARVRNRYSQPAQESTRKKLLASLWLELLADDFRDCDKALGFVETGFIRYDILRSLDHTEPGRQRAILTGWCEQMLGRIQFGDLREQRRAPCFEPQKAESPRHDARDALLVMLSLLLHNRDHDRWRGAWRQRLLHAPDQEDRRTLFSALHKEILENHELTLELHGLAQAWEDLCCFRKLYLSGEIGARCLRPAHEPVTDGDTSLAVSRRVASWLLRASREVAKGKHGDLAGDAALAGRWGFGSMENSIGAHFSTINAFLGHTVRDLVQGSLP